MIENYDERMAKEHEENIALATQQFVAGQRVFYSFPGGRCSGPSSVRNVLIGKLYDEMMAKAKTKADELAKV